MLNSDEIRKELLKKALELPLVPGVYIMHDAKDKVIYVGKSRKLQNRVSQYFMDNEKTVKTARMVASVRRFEYIVCSTEMEALTLENNLIKQHTPKYNIRLKDAKSYPYIKLSGGEYPRLSMSRKRVDDGAKYFGPYSGTSTVFAVINTVNRIFKLPSCHKSFPKDIGKERPCLYYQMGRCSGVCTGKISAEEYRNQIENVSSLLRGGVGSVKKILEQKMYDYAEQEQFEAAANCRDSINALSKLTEHQKAVTSPDSFRDVCAIGHGGGYSSVCLLKIREGKVVDRYNDIIPPDVPDEIAAAVSILTDYYRQSEDLPNELLLGVGFAEEDRELLEEYLCDKAEKKIHAFIPQRGDGKSLCNMALENAVEFANKETREAGRNDSISEKLAVMLHLEVVPERIEAYDISNYGAEHITAGMIVTKNGSFAKRYYRYFRISDKASPDDYGSMREALYRRLSKLCGDEPCDDESFSSVPDLLLIDGGEQHLNVCLEVLDKLGLDIPCAGMVKDGEHRTRALITPDGEIDIAKEQDIFVFIYKIQEEIHRFTVSRMTEAKRKTVRKSTLEKIDGIGPKKAQALLAAFGGLEKVKKARPEELSGVKGINENDAMAVYRYYHK